MFTHGAPNRLWVTDIAEHRTKPRFLTGEIFGGSQFHVRNIAFKGCDRQSRPFGESRIIGEIVATFVCGTTMGLKNGIEAESLRCLCDPQVGAARRRFDRSRVADQLDRVGHRNDGDGRASGQRRVDRAGYHRLGDERARCVMDEDNVWGVLDQRLEACTHRNLPRRATINRRLVAQVPRRLGENSGIVRVAHRLNCRDLRVVTEGRHGTRQDGLSANCAELLGTASASAQPPPCGNDNGGCPF